MQSSNIIHVPAKVELGQMVVAAYLGPVIHIQLFGIISRAVKALIF